MSGLSLFPSSRADSIIFASSAMKAALLLQHLRGGKTVSKDAYELCKQGGERLLRSVIHKIIMMYFKLVCFLL